jgi:hypothetical protein
VKALRVLRHRGSHIFLDNRSTDGGKVDSLPCRPPFTPQEDYWYSFLLEVDVSRPQGHGDAGRIRSTEKIHLIGARSRDLPANRIVPQPTTLQRAPVYSKMSGKMQYQFLLENSCITAQKMLNFFDNIYRTSCVCLNRSH